MMTIAESLKKESRGQLVEEGPTKTQPEEKEDPLSSLDPFWASKKGN